MDIFLSASGEAVYECEIALLYSFCGDVEEFSGLVWDIVRGLCCRIVVFVGIDTEDGEISGMARPHPVVGISAELSY